MPESRVLDLRSLPPPGHHPAVIGGFDALRAGEALVLIDGEAPRTLLRQFQDERPGGFDWNVLEAGPSLFRVEIRRRAADGERTVSGLLEGDHRRLDAMVLEVQSLATSNSFREADERFSEFACGLRRHMDLEEQVLFPLLEQAGAPSGGPTDVMREEHADIRRCLAEAENAIRTENSGRVEEALDDLTDTLTSHNTKEELVLYPMADEAAGNDRDTLVRRLQAF